MSATNGGRGTPPVPPASHAPPAQEVPIAKEVRWPSQITDAQRTEDGAVISFVVLEGGQAVSHSYNVGEPGKKRLLEVLSGGLQLP